MARGENAYFRGMVDDALAGDSNAYAILYVATYQNLYQRAYYYTQNEYKTQDILSRIYLEAFTTLDTLKSPRSFRVWVRNLSEKYIILQMREDDPEHWNDVKTIEPIPLRIQRVMYGRKAPTMNLDIAGQLLEYLFWEANITPNTLPLETLAEFHQYRMNQLLVQRFALTAAIVFLIMAPLWFIAPEFTVDKHVDHGVVRYDVTVNSLFNIKSVTAQLNNKMLPVTQSDRCIYNITPTDNGEMYVQVLYFNNMAKEQTITVTEVDRISPQVVESHLQNGVVTLVLSDDGSGIDYDAICITALTGEQLDITRDDTDGVESISFDYPGTNVDIVIPDMAGNRLHLLLSHNK